MFKLLIPTRLSGSKSIYLLEDTDFKCEVLGESNKMEGPVALEYKKRNLPIAKNITLLYASYAAHIYSGWHAVFSFLSQDKDYIDIHYPELEYGKKYYNCILRQLKRLQRQSRTFIKSVP